MKSISFSLIIFCVEQRFGADLVVVTAIARPNCIKPLNLAL